MRKLLFLPLFLLLVACSSAAAPVATSVPEDTGPEPETPAESEAAPASSSGSANKMPVSTGATGEEAAVIREQDYFKGSDEPVVTIIEYGDFQ